MSLLGQELSRSGLTVDLLIGLSVLSKGRRQLNADRNLGIHPLLTVKTAGISVFYLNELFRRRNERSGESVYQLPSLWLLLSALYSVIASSIDVILNSFQPDINSSCPSTTVPSEDSEEGSSNIKC